MQDAPAAIQPNIRNGRATAMPSGHSTVSIPAVRRAPYSVVNLNSGIFCRSSLFALNTAWSGYHGLGLALLVLAGALLEAEPVVVEGGRLVDVFDPPEAPV